jgi:hypothetical protein
MRAALGRMGDPYDDITPVAVFLALNTTGTNHARDGAPRLATGQRRTGLDLKRFQFGRVDP